MLPQLNHYQKENTNTVGGKWKRVPPNIPTDKTPFTGNFEYACAGYAIGGMTSIALMALIYKLLHPFYVDNIGVYRR